MTWTLWRGDDCLGTLHDRSALQPPQAVRPDARHVDAVLVPDPAYLPLPSIHQHVKELSGRRIVLEHARQPHVTGARRRTGDSPGPLGIWVVPPGPGSPLPSVPPERQLSVRDEDGRVLPTRSIGVLEHRPNPAHLPPELAKFPEGAFVGGSVWLVSLTLAPDAPAT